MKSHSKTSDGLDVASILYCHGFGSRFDQRKEKILALARVLPVYGITVDYTLHPRDVYEKHAAELRQHPKALIVGTSLGGFYASWLGAEYDRPFIAINPAIEPNKTLRAYLGSGENYAGDPYHLTEKCVNAYGPLSFRLDGPGTVVLDMDDEILNAQATLDFVEGRLPVVTFDGGSHRFDHMAELIQDRPELFSPPKSYND